MLQSGLVYGIHAVQQALSRRRLRGEQLLITHAGTGSHRLQVIRRLAQEQGISIEWVDVNQLDRLTKNGVHQGVVLLGQERHHCSTLEDIVVLHRDNILLLVLDSVQDPHNLGACMRTADAAGVHAIVAPRRRASGITAVVRKVASGAADTVPFIQVTNLARSLRYLKEQGIWIVAVDTAAQDSVFDADFKRPLALVLGNEGGGLRRLTRSQCDFAVSLPMCGTLSSLNISVAAGVCLYEVMRQRLEIAK